MTYAGDFYMRDDPTIFQKRFADFVRPYPAKVLARKANCTEHTAEAWRLGRSWPTAKHWLSLWIEFGDDVVESVFFPDRAIARLTREAQEREQARQQRIAAASMVEARTFGAGSLMGETAGPDSEPLEPGPANLDLFEELTTRAPG